MLEKIKNLNPWLIAIGISIAVEILFSLLALMFNLDIDVLVSEIGYILSVPTMKIMAYDITQSINEFSGGGREFQGFSEITVTVILSMFVIFILNPYLLIRVYQQADRSGDSKQRSWIWYSGAILIMASIFPVLVSSVIGTKVFMNTKESAKNSREMDIIRSELMDLAFDASYRLFLPVEKGGGDGSFRGFGDGTQTISLEDLESYSSDSGFEFQIHGEVSDSSFSIVAVSDNPGRKTDFENINGSVGRQQVSVEVKPYEEAIFQMQSSGRLMN